MTNEKTNCKGVKLTGSRTNDWPPELSWFATSTTFSNNFTLSHCSSELISFTAFIIYHRHHKYHNLRNHQNMWNAENSPCLRTTSDMCLDWTRLCLAAVSFTCVFSACTRLHPLTCFLISLLRKLMTFSAHIL